MNTKKALYLAMAMGLAGAAAFGASTYNVGASTQFTAPTKANPAAMPTAGRLNPPSPRGEWFAPLGLGILPPMQWPPENGDVTFLRLAVFWSVNNNVCFFDAGGFGTVTTGDLNGFQVGGLWNQVGGNVGGVQVGGIGNWVGGDYTGIQLGGLVNMLDGGGVFSGLQVAGAVNVAGDGAGLQLGLYNRAADFHGIQIGAINVAEHLEGLQIGLLNFILDSSLPCCPIIGVGF